MRIDYGFDLDGVFFGVGQNVIFVPGIVTKKNAEKILENLDWAIIYAGFLVMKSLANKEPRVSRSLRPRVFQQQV